MARTNPSAVFVPDEGPYTDPDEGADITHKDPDDKGPNDVASDVTYEGAYEEPEHTSGRFMFARKELAGSDQPALWNYVRRLRHDFNLR